MSHADAFLQAILERPTDDGPRLVFADWLEERDDPRGEFIRVQVELHHLPIGDPRHNLLQRRERELLAGHEPTWLGELASLGRCRFRRGLVEEIHLPAKAFLEHGEKIVRLAPIAHLHLRQANELANLLANATARRAFEVLLENVGTLDLSQNYLHDEALQTLLDMAPPPHLSRLLLASHNLSPVGLRALAESSWMAPIQFLDVGNRALSAETLHHLFSFGAWPKLTGVRLSATRLDGEALETLVNSHVMPQLTDLQLGHNGFGPSQIYRLATSSTVANLRSLDLSFNPLTPQGITILASSMLPNLTSLNLSRTDLGTEGVGYLAVEEFLGRLKVLDLSLNHLENSAGRVLADSPHATSLARLDLIYNRLSAQMRDRLKRRYGEHVCLFDR